MLFEGSNEGSGELLVTLHKSDSTEIAEAPGVWLDLKNVAKMYMKAKAALPDGSDNIPAPYSHGTEQPAEPGLVSIPDPNGNPFPMETPWDETPQTIVFVHGWRMIYSESISWAETMYKRLWHRGFKGRFAFFRWPTFTGLPILARYNESEYRAWKCGTALKQFVASLPYHEAMNVCAHSMGNIVVSSGLKQGMQVNNYLLMQAAVPSGCYNINQPDHQPFVDHGVGDPNPDGASDLGYRGFLEGISGNLANFYNFQDDALEAWDINNTVFKPNRSITASQSYGYEPTNTEGRRCALIGPLAFRLVLDAHESMAFVASSRTITAGREETGGVVDSDHSLDAYDFGDEHSAQWNRRIQQLVPFYNRMLDEFGIPFLP